MWSLSRKTIVEHYGLVQGARSEQSTCKDILAGFKNIVGGELTGYTSVD